MEPRGSTPPLEFTYASLLNIPPEYKYREPEYRELLGRGATPLMCEVYNLEFTPESGIIAWADDDLFEEFANEEMVEVGRWKIYLGRQIRLDPEDEDGAQFMINLLEETMYFFQIPTMSKPEHRWLNYKGLLDGVWVTKPEVSVDDGMDEDTAYFDNRMDEDVAYFGNQIDKDTPFFGTQVYDDIEYLDDGWHDEHVVANTFKNRYDTPEDVEGIEEELAIMAGAVSDGWDSNGPSNDEDVSSTAASESGSSF